MNMQLPKSLSQNTLNMASSACWNSQGILSAHQLAAPSPAPKQSRASCGQIPALQGGNEAERHGMSLAGPSSVSHLTGHLQNSTQSNRDPSKRKPFHSSHWAILTYLSLLNSCPYPSSLPKETWHCLLPPANVLLPICVESQRDGYSVLYIYTPHVCLPNERCYSIWVKKERQVCQRTSICTHTCAFTDPSPNLKDYFL